MIYIINIISKTREGTLYDEVALNKYPIVYVNDCGEDQLFDDKELCDAIGKKILSKRVYDNAKICVRCIDEEYNIRDLLYILRDKINLEFDGKSDN